METEHSKKFNDIKFYYDHHIWSKVTVKKACKTGRITADEYEEITGEAYVS